MIETEAGTRRLGECGTCLALVGDDDWRALDGVVALVRMGSDGFVVVGMSGFILVGGDDVVVITLEAHATGGIGCGVVGKPDFVVILLPNFNVAIFVPDIRPSG